MRRGWKRSEPARRARTWAGVLVAIGAAAAFLAPAAPASAAVLPATRTDLAVDRTTALPGDPVLLTASITVPSPPGTIPTGTVTFKRGTIALGTVLLADGAASLSVSNIPAGSRSLTATYSGNGTLAASTSAARTVVIGKGGSTTTVSAATNALPGDPILLSSTVTGPDAAHPATGTVTFKRGGTAIGTANLTNGEASLLAALPAGTLSITAVYNGSASLNGSASAATTVSVVKASTTTTISADASLAGAPASLTATVQAVGIARVPTGKVTFRRGTTSLGVVDVDASGVAHLSTALPTGSFTLTATYGGSTAFNGSASAPAAVDLQKAGTATTLALDPTGFSPAGSPVTLTATTTVEDGRVPTGSVVFKRGSTTIGSAPLVNGIATLTATLPIGSHAVTATYNGSTALIASTSTAQTLTVAKLPTFTYLEAPYAATYGAPIDLVASVTEPGYGRTPSGTVTFLRGSTVVGSAPVDGSGVARLTTQALPVGSPVITARYDGSGTMTGSTSSPGSVQVEQAPTSVAVAPFTPPSAAGDPVALSAAVTAASPSLAVPAGKVTFRSGTTALGQATLVNGIADLTTTALPAGATSVTASYSGNASFLPSNVTFESVLGAPTDVTATPDREAAQVAFAPPAVDGGSPIAYYGVIGTDLTDPAAPLVTAVGWWAPITVAGLTPGHSYSFVVEVHNEAGATATSDPSDAIVPLEACPVVDGLTERGAAAPGVDWHGCDLQDADLSGLDLAGADLNGASLNRANLTGADLGEADLRSTNLRSADLEGADLDGAQLASSSFGGLRSGGITGTPASLPSATYLVSGYLIGGGTYLREAELPGADLAGKIIGGADMTRANLHGANLRGAFAGYIVLEQADLSDADLSGGYILIANLRGANLRGADLTGIHLGGSDLTGADLTDADLTGADLASPPPYPPINLTGVTYCRTTMPNGEINNSGCPA